MNGPARGPRLEAAEVSRYHYKVIFKPETIIPDVERPCTGIRYLVR
ncbi:hypothetical protein [Nocardia carnea]|nr:hypothetical protein [Nocardia carnea]